LLRSELKPWAARSRRPRHQRKSRKTITMPIIVPEGHASAALLRSEGIEVLHQPPRHGSTLRVGLLNLMPDKIGTEVQFARLLGTTRRHVELVPALPRSYRSTQEAAGLYARWSEKSLPRRLDGLIVTGAPLERLPFEDVAYWRELVCICNWATGNVGSTLYICWAAFAALYMFHGVRTRVMPYKISGVFQQQVMDPRDPLTAGLGAAFPCPVSRYAEVAVHDVPWGRGLTCLAQSLESGLCLVADGARNAHYMFNHLEYDAETLKLEYLRDRASRAGTAIPQNYLPNDDISSAPPLVWRRPAEKLFANWLTVVATRAHHAADLGRSAA
jgi:homoserine O-succinyltransferase